jgi:hypothetical protein
MVALAEALLVLYPNADPMKDYRIIDQGAGATIAYWSDAIGERPTQQQIDATAGIILKAKIAEIRYGKEIGGIVIGAQPVSTNRDEMPIWQGMLLDMTLRPGITSSFEYKPRGGLNVTLTAQQVQRVYECFAWYVQACFATERQLIAAIDAGTPLEQVEAMLDTVWPQTQFEWTAPSN